jgi:hypothetical protein
MHGKVASYHCRDLRQRVGSLYGLHHDFLNEFARNIKCHHLLIKVVEETACGIT